jgi:flagellar assembly protein FliH
MTTQVPARAGVVRGLPLQALPLRLARLAVAASVTPPATATSRDDDALQAAREQVLREAREHGLRTGHDEGVRQGRAQAQQEVREAAEQAAAAAAQALHGDRVRLQALAGAAQAAVQEALAAAHDEMLALCYETICRVVGAAAVQPETVRACLSHVVGLAQSREAVVLHVHPQDAAWLAAGQDTGDSPEMPRWVADPSVILGGCILKSPAGALDARLESVLAACKRALLDARATAAAQATAQGERN